MKPIRIIGIGNTFAGDDALGPLLTKRPSGHRSTSVEVLEAGLSGLNLLSLMEGAEAAFLIDAVLSGQTPGTIHRLEIPRDLDLLRTHGWNSSSSSTHDLGLADSLLLGETLGTLPSTVIVFGIEIHHTTFGEQPSLAVRQAMDTLATHIHKEVDTVICMNSNS